MKNSAAYNRSSEGVEQAMKLLDDTRKDLLSIKKLLAEAREGYAAGIAPYCKQEELFDYGPATDGRLSRRCLGSLVETI
jgi:hypothetical protein